MRRRKKGQSTIEFIFVFFAFIVFLSLSYNAVVDFAVYQYLSYANFMAARAFQPSRATNGEQENKAVQTMGMYVPGLQVATPLASFGFSKKRILARNLKWLAPRALSPNLPFVLEFEVPLLVIPIGAENRDAYGWITLRTSVMLGREVSVQECQGFFDTIFARFSGGGGGSQSAAGMEDNGC